MKHADVRFLSSSYKQELYLKISTFSQENRKVEKYMREFEQLSNKVSN